MSGEDCLGVQKARKGDEVTVHYEGWLKSTALKFDSSLDRDSSITFELGTNRVVAGWEQGLIGTCPGQTIRLGNMAHVQLTFRISVNLLLR